MQQPRARILKLTVTITSCIILLAVITLPYFGQHSHFAQFPHPYRPTAKKIILKNGRSAIPSGVFLGTGKGKKERDSDWRRGIEDDILSDDESARNHCNRHTDLSTIRTNIKFDQTTQHGGVRFLPDYRNPCWRDKNSPTLRCLPYFFLAGFPKSGTTDMYFRITQHPRVLNARKEPHFITRKRFGGQSLKDYTGSYGKMFNNTNANIKQCILGDGSASTLWDNHNWASAAGNEGCPEPNVINADYVRHLNPRTKIIVMLRNPTSRLYSGYQYFSGKNQTSTAEFHHLVYEMVTQFHTCLQSNPLRACAYSGLNTQQRVRLHVGLYPVYVDDWLKRFPRDQFLFIRLEDVANNTETIMESVFDFLQLDQPSNRLMEKMLTAQKKNQLRSAKKLGPMWDSTRRLLDKFYRPYNNRLAAMLNDDRFLWKDT